MKKEEILSHKKAFTKQITKGKLYGLKKEVGFCYKVKSVIKAILFFKY